jgi:hypothetical protein
MENKNVLVVCNSVTGRTSSAWKISDKIANETEYLVGVSNGKPNEVLKVTSRYKRADGRYEFVTERTERNVYRELMNRTYKPGFTVKQDNILKYQPQ